MYVAVVEGVGVDACIHLVGVGTNTDCNQGVVAVYFYLPGLYCLCAGSCLLGLRLL